MDASEGGAKHAHNKTLKRTLVDTEPANEIKLILLFLPRPPINSAIYWTNLRAMRSCAPGIA